MKDIHPTKTEFNEKTGVSEPVLTNRHSHAERWEWDPDWTREDQKKLEERRNASKNPN